MISHLRKMNSTKVKNCNLKMQLCIFFHIEAPESENKLEELSFFFCRGSLQWSNAEHVVMSEESSIRWQSLCCWDPELQFLYGKSNSKYFYNVAFFTCSAVYHKLPTTIFWPAAQNHDLYLNLLVVHVLIISYHVNH